MKLTSAKNIRGRTPLHTLVRYMHSNLHNIFKFGTSRAKDKVICLNILTDGIPDDSIEFEKELIAIAADYNIFLVINLCVDETAISEYYN